MFGGFKFIRLKVPHYLLPIGLCLQKNDVQDMPPLAMILDIIAVGYYDFALIVD